MNIGPLIALLGCAYIFAHILSAVFLRTRIPDVLILSLVGVFIGPIMGWIRPEHFGKIGPIASTATLAVLLFNSGTSLKLKELGSTAWRVTWLTMTTFIATVSIVTVVLYYLADLPMTWALLCGVIVGGTSSAVVIPMMAASNVTNDTKTILIMESTLTDVLVIVLAFAVMESINGEAVNFATLASDVFLSFFVAAVIGVLGGFMWLKTWDSVRQYPDTVLGTIAYAFIFFGIAELMGFSGGIAALSFGVTIANAPLMKPLNGFSELNHVEKSFYNEIVFILKIFFFLYLGISIELKFDWILFVAIISVLLIYAARLVITRFSFSKTTAKKDLTLSSIMVPKGLAAAVVAGVPKQQGLPYGDEIQSFVYLVVILSIILTSILVPLSEHLPLKTFYDSVFKKFGAAPKSNVNSPQPQPTNSDK